MSKLTEFDLVEKITRFFLNGGQWDGGIADGLVHAATFHSQEFRLISNERDVRYVMLHDPTPLLSWINSSSRLMKEKFQFHSIRWPTSYDSNEISAEIVVVPRRRCSSFECA